MAVKYGTTCIIVDTLVRFLFIAWRKMIRKLFKLPNRTHNYIVCGIVECTCISVKLDRRLAKFVYSMLNSRNSTVFKLIRLFLKSDSSTFAENVRYLKLQI